MSVILYHNTHKELQSQSALEGTTACIRYDSIVSGRRNLSMYLRLDTSSNLDRAVFTLRALAKTCLFQTKLIFSFYNDSDCSVNAIENKSGPGSCTHLLGPR